MIAHQQLVHLLFALQHVCDVALYAQQNFHVAFAVALCHRQHDFVLSRFFAWFGCSPDAYGAVYGFVITHVEDDFAQVLKVVAIKELCKVYGLVLLCLVA